GESQKALSSAVYRPLCHPKQVVPSTRPLSPPALLQADDGCLVLEKGDSEPAPISRRGYGQGGRQAGGRLFPPPPLVAPTPRAWMRRTASRGSSPKPAPPLCS